MKHVSCLMLVALIVASVSLPAAGQRKSAGKEVGVSVTTAITSPGSLSATDIFVQGFNDTLVFPPAGWTMINRDGNVSPTDTAWYQSRTIGPGTSGPPYEGIAFAADYYGTANSFYIDDYLITPNTGGTAPAGSVDSLTFWLAARLSTSGNYPDSLDIRVSTTGRNANDFTTRLGYVLAPKSVWRRFAYALPITATRYIAFRYLLYDGGPDGANSDKICLDDVRIGRYSPTGVADKQGVPKEFGLQQNYPNPFNPTTRIEFSVTASALAVLTVHNILGQEVARLVNEHLQPGTYATDFVANNLPSGVYYYRLAAGNSTKTRQMVLLK